MLNLKLCGTAALVAASPYWLWQAWSFVVPGLLARELIGRRSYKNDDRAKHTPERLIARKDIATALEAGTSRLGLRLKLSHAQRDALAEDGSGDALDAVLCLVQAGWAAREGPPRWGLPEALDPLEGWIVSA